MARSGTSTGRLESDASLAILTDRDPDALEVLRHSSAHILATAVRELFPGAGIGFGPPIEDGFYYDFQVDRPFTPEDLERIEAEDGRGGQRGLSRSCARWWTAPRPTAASPTTRSSSSESRSWATTRPSRSTPTDRSSDLCRGPARPAHRPAQALQAAARRRRLLAGRREAPDAAADLRHGLVQEGGPRRPTSTGSRRRGSATTASWANSSTCSRSQELVGPGLVLWHPKGAMIKWLLTRAVEDDNVAQRLRPGVHAQHDPGGAVQDLGASAALRREPVSADGRRRTAKSEDVRYRVKPMNCPMHALIYRASSGATAICRSG